MNLDRYKNLVSYSTDLAAKLTGNVYTQSNAQMVVSRLKRRMIDLKMEDPEDYLAFLKKHQDSEKEVLVGLLTTHHTFFFREFIHFEYLKQALPEIVKNAKKQGRQTLKIWSAAASRGHEAVSLSLFLDHYISQMNLNIKFEILGTDVDPESIKFAQKGLYPYQDVKEIPAVFLTGKWLRGSVDGKMVAKVKENFSAPCTYKVDNLLDLKTNEQFDLILCRNVLIYFDAQNVRKILNSLRERLYPDGLLITGVSEPVGHLCPGMSGVGPCVYAKGGSNLHVVEAEKKTAPIRVVNVDDSKSVLKVLKKIFTDNPHYELVGQVENGEKLKSFLDTHQVDVVTLDLHMPVLGGVEYLEKYYTASHPAVVIVSSVNRDNEELGKKAIELGALDYIEKPNLQNFDKCAEEMTNKIQTICRLKEVRQSAVPLKVQQQSLPPAIKTKVKAINLILFCSSKEHDKLFYVLKELVGYGLFPKAIVAPYLEHEENWQRMFKSLGVNESFYKNNFFIGMSTFLIKFSREFLKDKYTLCFYKSSGLIDSLSDLHLKRNYILSESRPKSATTKVHIMPSPSWAYHIHETFSEDSLKRNVWLQADICEERGIFFVHQNEVLALGYDRNERLSQFMITNKSLSSLPSLAGFKAVGLKRNIDKFGLELQNLGGILLKKIIRNEEYSFKVERGVVSLAVAPKVSLSKQTKIKVMVIDDSATMGKILKKFLDDSPKFVCSDVVSRPSDVLARLKDNRPDVITLDVNMPEMNGVEVFRRFIKPLGIPTIVVSSSLEESDDVLQLLNDGAFDYLQKPSLSEMNKTNFPLWEKVELASCAKIQNQANSKTSKRHSSVFEKNTIIAFGSSTGGTRALSHIFSSFPEKFPPVVVAQHIPAGFSRSFAKQLHQNNPFDVVEARDGDKLRDNCVFIAPGSKNMIISKEGSDYILRILPAKENEFGIPSVNQLFHSVASSFEGQMIGILLTGMGKDGALGLLEMKKKGAYTMAQDEESCVVYGMPRAARENGAALDIVSLDEVTHSIFKIFKNKAA